MVRRVPSAFVVLAGVAVALGGFTATATGAAQTKAARAGLTQFLLRAGEETGFAPVGRVKTISSVTALVKFDEGTSAEARRLRSEGYVSFTYQSIKGASGPGTSNVEEFAAGTGARRELAYEGSPSVLAKQFAGAKLKRFAVPGVPGAVGFTASQTHKLHVGNVFWTEGRCEMTLGNEGPGPFSRSLSAGVKAIYDRTHGECP